ncbi:MAG: ABC transporter substrate-binding protein [Gammaproteobacteria bacterium]|nr:ABC transporter substrate-binding protein [Gammaproteobacteria bacterium]
MSYHKGYEWNDGIENGVVEKLKGACELKKVYMDTKRNNSVEFGQAAALKAKLIIEEFKPQVVIVTDDNASRYLVEPYFKNKKLPFIFCGLNWTAEEYGYPYENATGMVEVAPIVPLLKNIQRSVGIVTKGVYLSSDTLTEHTDFLHYKQEYSRRGVNIIPIYVSTMKEWKDEFVKAQTSDFIILANNAGINDWEISEVTQFVNQKSKILSVANYQWMMPYAMLGVTKNAREQGLWAGEVAVAVLNGLSVKDIPITINKSWHFFINKSLLSKTDISLSNRILNHASKNW